MEQLTQILERLNREQVEFLVRGPASLGLLDHDFPFARG